jgi:hypothetical protein
MIEPQTSQVNIPPTVKKGGFYSKLGAGLGGLAGAVGGFFTGGPVGAVMGGISGAQSGYNLGMAADKPGIKENQPVGGEKTPMVRALSRDPQAQNYALELGKNGLPKDDPRYAYIETAQQKLKEKWGTV